MKEFDLHLKNEDEINKLLDCDYIIIGNVRFIKETKVVDMLKNWKNKFMSSNGNAAEP